LYRIFHETLLAGFPLFHPIHGLLIRLIGRLMLRRKWKVLRSNPKESRPETLFAVHDYQLLFTSFKIASWKIYPNATISHFSSYSPFLPTRSSDWFPWRKQLLEGIGLVQDLIWISYVWWHAHFLSAVVEITVCLSSKVAYQAEKFASIKCGLLPRWELTMTSLQTQQKSRKTQNIVREFRKQVGSKTVIIPLIGLGLFERLFPQRIQAFAQLLQDTRVAWQKLLWSWL